MWIDVSELHRFVDRWIMTLVTCEKANKARKIKMTTHNMYIIWKEITRWLAFDSINLVGFLPKPG